MEKVTNNCDDIKNASKKNTNISILPYKTAILHGAISIIRDFKKKTENGIDYKSLCEKISKYVNSRKQCVRQELKEKGKNLITNEWKTVITSLLVTFNKYEINSLCYFENDNEVSKKKEVLNIHNVFRKFCIEKKNRLRNSSHMDFEECDKFLSWISEKKMELQGHDPGYKNIEEYQKYFNIHDNCNYPWLLKDIPDITCQRITRIRAREQNGKGKPLGDVSPLSPVLTKDRVQINKKESPSRTQPSSKKKGDPMSNKTPEKGSEKAPKQITSSPNTDVNHQSNSSSVILQGDHVHPNKGGGAKKEVTSMHPQQSTDSTPSVQTEPIQKDKTLLHSHASPSPPEDINLPPAIQHPPSPTATTSSSSSLSPVNDTTSSQTIATPSSLTITSDSSANSGSLLTSNVLPPVADTKDQDTAPQSSITSGTLASTHPNQSVPSTMPSDSSLPQAPVPTAPAVVTTAKEPGKFIPSSANTIKTTTAATDSVTISTSTTKAPIPPTEQVPSVSDSQEPPPPSASEEPKATVPITDPHQTVAPTPTPVSGSDNGGVSVPTQPVTIDNNQQATLSSAPSLKIKDLIKLPGVQSENSITPLSEYTASGNEDMKSSKIQKTVGQTDIKHNIPSVQMGTNNDHDQLIHLVSVDPGKIPDIKLGKDHNNNPVTHKGKNDKPNIIPEGIPPLTHIIPSLLVILATITLLFQLYKYTPFGFLLGRRRKRKKRDLRNTFVIPEESTYESPNITVHEWEDPNLVGQTVENDVYTKLLKINRYKQEMQKRKKKNKKTLIEVHMEVLEEHKNDEWELHKGDFLEICLRGFINDENDFYSNFSNLKSILNNIKNEKTIEDIQKQEILWNNWIEDHRNILEQWKKEEWFHILKNEWRKEQQIYKEKKYKLQENTLNEQDTHSIISQKDIWKHWILKQATLIDLFNKEDWFKSLVYVQDEEKDNYLVNEYNNITVTNENQLKNEKVNHEHGRSKNIIKKLMVQIHMMVLEECIKEDIIKHKELCIDNFIEDTYNQNNYDENRNRPQCDTHDFSVPVYEEIHTSTNK
ncbi:STP1 protein [Plasmodium ovale wallikeri]|uniref:STP1 protein n=1 Tax=Plasmodium ovale wallikeri TaxID=864142 RepID=A0A1A9AT07_PLAOA|nr:STP1 protein [Plasmodium ovale wallikeri]